MKGFDEICKSCTYRFTENCEECDDNHINYKYYKRLKPIVFTCENVWYNPEIIDELNKSGCHSF